MVASNNNLAKLHLTRPAALCTSKASVKYEWRIAMLNNSPHKFSLLSSITTLPCGTEHFIPSISSQQAIKNHRELMMGGSDRSFPLPHPQPSRFIRPLHLQNDLAHQEPSFPESELTDCPFSGSSLPPPPHHPQTNSPSPHPPH